VTDDEALDKVRARMVEWQAYVAQPHTPTSWVDVAGDESVPDSVREEPFGFSSSSLAIASIISARGEMHPERGPGKPPRDHPLPNQVHTWLSQLPGDHPVIVFEASSEARNGRGPSPGTAFAGAARDGVDDHLTGLQESLQHEREQSRRLTEVVAREQLLQAYALRAATEPRSSARRNSVSRCGPAYWQRRRRLRREWFLLIAWILILAAGVVVLTVMSYDL
jgi:hypothetical protein